MSNAIRTYFNNNKALPCELFLRYTFTSSEYAITTINVIISIIGMIK